MYAYKHRGFTLVELLVVIAIIALLASVLTVALQNMNRRSALQIAVQEIYTALVRARADTLASIDDTVYGVHVDSNQVVRFAGATYTPGDPNNIVYVFSSGVSATGTPVAADTSFVFRRLTGTPSATGTIVLISDTYQATRTVEVTASGLIQ